MRLSLPAILFTGLLLGGTSGGPTEAEPSEETVAAIKPTLQRVLERSTIALKAAEGRVGLVEVKQAGLPFGSVRGYDADRVRTTASEIRSELAGAFAQGELAGLRAYVDQFFPEVELQSITLGSRDGKCNGAPCPHELAEQGSVSRVYSNIHEFVAKVVGATAYKVEFRVRSRPTGARFSLQPLGGGFVTETPTDGQIGGLFRGLYRYKIERQGFKPVEATINLVDNDPSELYCELTAEDSSNTSLPCLFGVIE